jgi:hypothetical protein
MTPARCNTCWGETDGSASGIVHAYSCPQRQEGEPARCDYSKCRAAHWKESTGYGHQAGLRASRNRSHGRRKPGGIQLSYRKSAAELAKYLANAGGLAPRRAEHQAEEILRKALPPRQLIRLEEIEARRG